MAWKETTKMEQKIEFINEWRGGRYSLTELRRAFDISRPTAYKYIKRYQEEGIEGLKEKSSSLGSSCADLSSNRGKNCHLPKKAPKMGR